LVKTHLTGAVDHGANIGSEAREIVSYCARICKISLEYFEALTKVTKYSCYSIRRRDPRARARQDYDFPAGKYKTAHHMPADETGGTGHKDGNIGFRTHGKNP
jgi:hypothetical protein